MSDATAVADVQAQVREFLSTFDDVTKNDDGTCTLSYGSAEVTVTVSVFDEDQAVVKVRAEAVVGAKPSPELFHHIATYSAEIGHLRAVEESDGTVTILLCHGLLGEFLNPAELRMTVVALALVADQIDDGLAERFGGTVHDASANLA